MKKCIAILSVLFAVNFTTCAETTKVVNSQTQLTESVVVHNHKALQKTLSGARYLNLNARDARGKTALDLAVEAGNIKVAKKLVNLGAKVTTRDNAAWLQDMYRNRSMKFFVGGFFMWPLWIGCFTSLSKASTNFMLID